MIRVGDAPGSPGSPDSGSYFDSGMDRDGGVSGCSYAIGGEGEGGGDGLSGLYGARSIVHRGVVTSHQSPVTMRRARFAVAV
jgi:hypothetical protein